MRTSLALLATILFLGAVCADEYPIGFTDFGYEYKGGGVWYADGQSYTRHLYQQSGYWSCGSYYPGKFVYRYREYTAPKAYKEPEVPKYTDPGWRGKLLDIAQQRDRYEGEIRKSQFDHQQYLEAVNALGLTGNFRWNSYGQTPPYSYGQPGGQYQMGRQMPYEFQGSINYGVQGNSQYGYSYNTIAQLYGDTNLSGLYQQAAQLAAGAQKLSGEATVGFSDLVGKEGGNRARVAEILARGQMAQQVLNALQGPGETKTYQFKFSPKGDIERIPEPNVDPEVKKGLLNQLSALAGQRCAGCHSGDTKKGGFDIATYPTLSEEGKKAVWQLLTTDDDTKRMPRAANGGPGKKLTPEELRLFLSN